MDVVNDDIVDEERADVVNDDEKREDVNKITEEKSISTSNIEPLKRRRGRPRIVDSALVNDTPIIKEVSVIIKQRAPQQSTQTRTILKRTCKRH